MTTVFEPDRIVRVFSARTRWRVSRVGCFFEEVFAAGMRVCVSDAVQRDGDAAGLRARLLDAALIVPTSRGSEFSANSPMAPRGQHWSYRAQQGFAAAKKHVHGAQQERRSFRVSCTGPRWAFVLALSSRYRSARTWHCTGGHQEADVVGGSDRPPSPDKVRSGSWQPYKRAGRRLQAETMEPAA